MVRLEAEMNAITVKYEGEMLAVMVKFKGACQVTDECSSR
jgi:hypothetical protein